MIQNRTGPKKEKTRLRWVIRLLWIGLGAVSLFVASLVTEVIGRWVAGNDSFTNIVGRYCVKYDRCYVEEYWNHTNPRDWQSIIILMDIHSAEDLDFNDYYDSYILWEDFYSPSEETKKILYPLQRFLYSGIRTYGAMKIYDPNGNVLKGTEFAMVQSDPCMYLSTDSAVKCIDQTLGYTNLKEYLTENEINEIAEVFETDPNASVALDRYVLNEETYKLYIPLSVLVRGSDGSEKLHLTLDRQKGEETGETVYTEEVYVHRPSEHFQKMSSFGKSHEAAFEEWIEEMQMNKDPKADRKLYYGDPPVKGFGPFHEVAVYYEGQELTTYTYFYCSMMVPFLRIFFLLWDLISLPYWLVVLVIRFVGKRKNRNIQNLKKSLDKYKKQF